MFIGMGTVQADVCVDDLSRIIGFLQAMI